MNAAKAAVAHADDVVAGTGLCLELGDQRVDVGCHVCARAEGRQALALAGDLAETQMCPLARFIRKRLRKRGIEQGVRCIYSTEPARNRRPPAGPDPEPDTFERGRPRKPIGSLPYMTGIFGLLAAYEALRILVPLTPQDGDSAPCAGRPG